MMENTLGNISHDYWWDEGVYFRRKLVGGPVEVWDGSKWSAQ